MQSEPCLEMWTVYAHPRDFPEQHVARLFRVRRSGIELTKQVVVSPELEDVRRVLRDDLGLACLPRAMGDEAHIVETWL